MPIFLLLLLLLLLSLLSQSLLVFFLCISRAQTMHLERQSLRSIIIIIIIITIIIIIIIYLFIYLFQTLLEQIKRRYGNNYSGLPFEKIKTTIGLNSKLNTISSSFTAEKVL